jgi:hypothetical protein
MRITNDDTVWECFEKRPSWSEDCDPCIRLRLICKKNREVGLLGNVTQEISSTALYPIITESVGEARRQRLQNQVLSTDLFCDFLVENGFDDERLAEDSEEEKM